MVIDKNRMNKIYDPEYVEKLFDKMSRSYKRMNYITSFGFSELWRNQCVDAIKIKENSVVLDLLTGMGECWESILKKSGAHTKIIGLDFSKGMLKYAEIKRKKLKANIRILNEDVFNNSLQDGSIDHIISGFGLKTFSQNQLELLAGEIERVLKVNGEFSLIDVSVSKHRILRFFYMFYLKRIIPILGWLFLGNPETYKMLGVYTENFQNSRQVEKIFSRYNLKVEYREYFFGCASGINGRKIQK